MNVTERFLQYVSFPTQSDETSDTCPSTACQLALGQYLRDELASLGAKDVCLDENGYVYATIPASKGYENAPKVMFCSHMDTAEEAGGENIRPRIIKNYDGSDIVLNEEYGIVSAVKDLPKLLDHVGEDLIVTDGTTLLGADCKAGIAEIVTAAESMLCDPYLPHPEVRIVFTPDEEIGRGPDRIDMEKVNCDFGYTMDGCLVGELEYENFNAWRADIVISGVAVHPGSSFGIMKNASLIAAEFVSMLPEKETPYYTKEREGFYHLTNMEGGVESARLKYILRDHDMEKERERIRVIEDTAAKLNEKYGEGTVTAVISEQYRNMKEKLIPGHENILEAARAGIAATDETLSEPAVRGGTDGARFSFMGLPCPNLGMGAFYCHGPHEFTTVQQMEKGVKLILNILERIR
ncbi:MAG: peptidase T [Lachnospiraceae bacterium]|nr:peptidase T [Lachnospiraceae bacterium]